MAWLSAILEKLTGSWASIITVPALVLTVIVSLHQLSLAKEERLRNEGKVMCDAGWEIAIRTQERDAATRNVRAVQDIAEGERRINEGLKNELHALRDEADKLREGAAAADARCLSDGVLDALRKRQAVERGGKGGGGH